MDDRALLQRLIAGPATGSDLADAAGQTRAAVWKRIQGLRDAGVAVDAQAGRGYALAQPLDLLDVGAIRAALPPAAASRLGGLEVAWSIDSTNSELLRRGAGRDGPDALATVLIAERQTGGRGRRGRSWASPLAAHLYLSASRGFGGGLGRLGGLSLVTGVATAEALRDLGLEAVRLKWPNDLVTLGPDGTRKLGGLLVEGAGEVAGEASAVIGLGLNVRMPAAYGSRIDQPWLDLRALCDAAVPAIPVPARSTLAAAVLARWLPALDLFDEAGLAPFLPRYAALDALVGASVDLRFDPAGAGAVLTGTALGLAGDGALRVRLADGSERAFHSGEVSVRRGREGGA